MENASKAIIMASSVLIGMIILSLLVAFFQNLRTVKQAEVSSDQVEQAVEYNKQYEVYNRTVYGSELLSIAHKVADYNIREADAKDYLPIELEVRINDSKMIEILNKEGSFRKDTRGDKYLSDELTKLVSQTGGIEKLVDSKGKKQIVFSTGQKRQIKQLATMRQKDIDELGTPSEDYQSLIIEYNELKSVLTEFKAKKFKVVEFKYDDNSGNATGRITRMIYELI